ncbi:MAG: PQQ-dependent sugar dehydrogenase [Polaromonas sp.]
MEVVVGPDFSQNEYLFFTTAYGTEALNGTHVVRAKWVGDGLERKGEAQNPSSHQGKVIRIDREGQAPLDNPFLSHLDARPEIYSLGRRNSQGIAFDKVAGVPVASEHGPRGGDEINLILPGANYGWPMVTDGIDYAFARISLRSHRKDHSDPLLQWRPSIAPSGLAIYRGAHFSQWQVALLVPALKERAIRAVTRYDENPQSQLLILSELDQRIRGVKVVGRIVYVVTDGEAGRLLKLTAPRPVKEVQ